MKFIKPLTSRFTLVSLSLVIQVLFLWLIATSFEEQMETINIVVRALSVIVICYVLNQPTNPSITMTWIVFILLYPVFGSLVYILTGGKRPGKRLRKACEEAEEKNKKYNFSDTSILEKLKAEDRGLHIQAKYLDSMGFGVFENTSAKYFPLGDEAFPVMLEEMKKAEKFIFMEYFILGEGRMLTEIEKVLEEKAKQGVDVRILFDDMGSLFSLPPGYEKSLLKKGIKCHAFNPYVPVMSAVMNNRDHRKILVIDSHVAFTGGINIADEYINEVEKFGHWKDNTVMLKGEGAKEFTLLFLNMWNAVQDEDEDAGRFFDVDFKEKGEGYIQPFCDTPMDDELVSECVYLNAINNAKDYIYIFTPYLIPDYEMLRALCLAAKKGVDVRILVPGIADKKFVYAMTKSYFSPLVKCGVKIYKYTPGFLHAKGFVSDDNIACTGTVNLDFRSLYHHFECGCVFYNAPVIQEVKTDFTDTIKKSEEVKTRQHIKGIVKNAYYAVLRLISPLM